MFQWAHEIDVVALWGAVLSTILAIREYVKSRVKIDVGFNFTTHPNIGNEVILRNFSSHPVIVKYWKLVKRKNCITKPISPSIAEPDESFRDFVISESSSITLSFKEQDYFSSSPDALKGNKIYIYIYIVGKRLPVVKKVYG